MRKDRKALKKKKQGKKVKPPPPTTTLRNVNSTDYALMAGYIPGQEYTVTIFVNDKNRYFYEKL